MTSGSSDDAVGMEPAAFDPGPWLAIVNTALQDWKGGAASATWDVRSEPTHAALEGAISGRAVIVSARLSGSFEGSAALLVSEEEARSALGLDEGAPVGPIVEEFARSLQAATPPGEEIAIEVRAEKCGELSAEGIAALRTLLPVEPIRCIEAVVTIAEGSALTVVVALHRRVVDVGREAERLAEIGLGRDLHGHARSPAASDDRLGLLMDVELPLIVRLGEADLTLDELLNLRPGSVIELNRLVNDPVELIVNNRTVAYGEVVVVHENFGLRVTSLAGTEGENHPQ